MALSKAGGIIYYFYIKKYVILKGILLTKSNDLGIIISNKMFNGPIHPTSKDGGLSWVGVVKFTHFLKENS